MGGSGASSKGAGGGATAGRQASIAAPGDRVKETTDAWRAAEKTYKAARTRYLDATVSPAATPAEIARLRKEVDAEAEIVRKAARRLDRVKAGEIRAYVTAEGRRRKT